MNSKIAHPFVLVFFLAASLGAFGASVKELFVSPRGNDTSRGTLERPFRTISCARDAIRELEESGRYPDEGVTVYLRGGTYPLTKEIVFLPEDSGKDGAPVTYRSAPGETAVLSGGVPLPDSWTPVPGRPYWRLDVSAVNGSGWRFGSLYVNGVSCQQARYPNWDQKVLRAEGASLFSELSRQAFTY